MQFFPLRLFQFSATVLATRVTMLHAIHNVLLNFSLPTKKMADVETNVTSNQNTFKSEYLRSASGHDPEQQRNSWGNRL
jgi:hypothetical protein